MALRHWSIKSCFLAVILIYLNRRWHLPLPVARLVVQSQSNNRPHCTRGTPNQPPSYWWQRQRGRRVTICLIPSWTLVSLSGWYWKDAPGFPPAKHQAERPLGNILFSQRQIFLLGSHTDTHRLRLCPIFQLLCAFSYSVGWYCSRELWKGMLKVSISYWALNVPIVEPPFKCLWRWIKRSAKSLASSSSPLKIYRIIWCRKHKEL